MSMTLNSTSRRAAIGVQGLPKLHRQNSIQEKIRQLKQEKRDYQLKNEAVLVYLSKQGDPRLNINGKTKDGSGMQIVCRHLAYFVALKGIKDYHAALQHVDKLAEQTVLMDNHFDGLKINFKSTYYQVLSLEYLGRQLQNIAGILNKEEQCSLLFQSENHVMAMSIQRKDGDSYTLKFYDPNQTNVHLRAFCSDLNAVGTLTIEDFLSAARRDDYFPAYKTAILTSPYTRQDPDRSPIIEVHEEALNAKLYFALRYGWPKEVAQHLESILSSNETQNKKYTLLTARNANGTPGFHFVLRNDDDASLCIYMNAILRSGLSNQQKGELLLARPLSGAQGLFYPLQQGHVKTVRAYTDIILRSNLSKKQKVELISGTRDDGLPGVFMALEEGHYQTVSIYLQAISQLKLSPKVKEDLLLSKSKVALLGLHLYLSLKNGHDKTARRYLQELINQVLPYLFDGLAKIKEVNLENNVIFSPVMKKNEQGRVLRSLIELISRMNLQYDDQVNLLGLFFNCLNQNTNMHQLKFESFGEVLFSCLDKAQVLQNLKCSDGLLRLVLAATNEGKVFREVVERVETACFQIDRHLSKKTGGHFKQQDFKNVERQYRRTVYQIAYKALTCRSTDMEEELYKIETMMGELINHSRQNRFFRASHTMKRIHNLGQDVMHLLPQRIKR